MTVSRASLASPQASRKSSGSRMTARGPVALVWAKGLLTEPERTNLLLRSQEFDHTAWSKIGTLTVTANDTTAPDGTLTADRIVDSDTASSALLQQVSSNSVDIGTVITTSVFAKQGTFATFTLNCYIVNGAENNTKFTFASGTALTATGIANTWQYVGNGWFRVTQTFTADQAGQVVFRVWPGDRDVNAPTGHTFAWGAQAEVGAFATAYILTTSAQVTRAADTAVGATLAPWVAA